MKTIGLIGGMSWESSLEYYRIINQLVRARLGGNNNARSLLLSVNFHEIEGLQRAGDWKALGLEMQRCALTLEAAGADFLMVCTNTMHLLAPEIEAVVKIPLLHIIDPTAAAIKARGFRHVGLLGTRFTMEQEFYKERLATKHGLTVTIPPVQDRNFVHATIFDELCQGTLLDTSRWEMLRAIRDLAEGGAEAVILGCTEIQLLVKPEDSPVPLFDTTYLHAEAAVEWALE